MFLYRELRDEEIPDDQLKLLEGMERTPTWKPQPLKFAKAPALILTGFILFILLLAKLWMWMLAAPLPGIVVFIALYYNSPTLCATCKREMDYYKPVYALMHDGRIEYDWCKHCKKYCNVRWVRDSRENGSI